MINLLPFDDSRPLLGLRDGFYFKRQERGYGLQVTVVGAMPHTPEEFEQAVSRLMGTRYEITLAAGYEAPEGSNEQEFLRRGFWRMVFFPSSTVHRAESNPTPRRVRVVREDEQVRPPRRRSDNLNAAVDVVNERHNERRRGLSAALEVERERYRQADLAVERRARERMERAAWPRNADGSPATINVGDTVTYPDRATATVRHVGMDMAAPIWIPAEDRRGVALRIATINDHRDETYAFPTGVITPELLRQLQNDPAVLSYSTEMINDAQIRLKVRYRDYGITRIMTPEGEVSF